MLSPETIQSSILGCRTPRTGQVCSLCVLFLVDVFNEANGDFLCLQWIRMLFFQKMKFKNEDDRQSYAIEHPEPLLYFALSSGSHSDPAVHF